MYLEILLLSLSIVDQCSLHILNAHAHAHLALSPLLFLVTAHHLFVVLIYANAEANTNAKRGYARSPVMLPCYAKRSS